MYSVQKNCGVHGFQPWKDIDAYMIHAIGFPDVLLLFSGIEYHSIRRNAMQVTLTLPEHLADWLNDKDIFREDIDPEDIVLACLEDAYEDDRHGQDDA